MKLSIRYALLFFCLLACANLTHAQTDERQQIARRILAVGPTPCIDQAMDLMSSQILRVAAIGFMKGAREAAGKGGDWREGHAGHDAVMALVSQAMEDDVRQNGPLLVISVPQLVNGIADAEPLADLRRHADFFSRRAGRLYWEYIVDGAQCLGLLEALVQDPYPPLTGQNKAIRERLVENLVQVRQRYESGLQSLPAGERQLFLDEAGKLNEAFKSSLERVGKQGAKRVQDRMVRVLKPRFPEIRSLINDWSEQQVEKLQ